MILEGDSLHMLAEIEDESVDLIVTDPPYGYSFMGKAWDKAVPHVEIWQECLRVLKPGAFCYVMSAPRSDVQMHMISRLTEAGFRMDFTPIYWTYASGFPKAGNIGKLVDKRLGVDHLREFSHKNPADRPYTHKQGETSTGWQSPPRPDKTHNYSDEAKALDGSYAGFQPKPAVEVILVAMKPLSEKTFVDQALKNGKGITWLDDCRVPVNETDPNHRPNWKNHTIEKKGFVYGEYAERKPDTLTQGRFPANLIVSDDVLNDGVERKSPRGTVQRKSDKFSGKYNNGADGHFRTGDDKAGHGDSGSYSRYFDLDKWASTLPFLIVPKASKSEKNKGLEHMPTKEKAYDYGSIKKSEGRHGENTARANHHPTVKPLKLMSYLITLGSRPGDTVLDPFVGSGTTVVSAFQLGRNGIGIEREPEYAEIARARLNHVYPQLPPEQPEAGQPPITVEDITKDITQTSLF